MNQHIRAFKESEHVAMVFPDFRGSVGLPDNGLIRVGDKLVFNDQIAERRRVGGIDYRLISLLQPVGQADAGMIAPRCTYLDPENSESALLGDGLELNRCIENAERYRGIMESGLTDEYFPELKTPALPSQDHEPVSLDVHGHKKRKTLDVVPVWMTQQNGCLTAALPEFSLHQLLAQITDACAAIQDDQVVFFRAYFHTGGISAVTDSGLSRRWIRASAPPDFHLHENKK